MPTVRDLLKSKGNDVHTVSPARTVLEAVYLMNEHHVGALVVTEGQRVVGMFTERDILRRVVADQRPPSQILVSQVMTRDVLYCSPDASVDEAAMLMKERRVRHLPICDSSHRLVGLVSIGDINAHHLSAQAETIHYLEEYVYSSV